jgi:hypothetical protein
MTRDEAVKFLRTVKLYKSRVRVKTSDGSQAEGVVNEMGDGPFHSGPCLWFDGFDMPFVLVGDGITAEFVNA